VGGGFTMQPTDFPAADEAHAAQGERKYMNITRRVALLRSRESDFADAVSDFIGQLGLQMTEIVAPLPGDLRGVAGDVERAAETCAAAVVVVESAGIQETLVGSASGRAAQPSIGALTLMAYAIQRFDTNRVVVVKQKDDPLRLADDEITLCLLSNDGAATRALRKALQAAGTTIEASRLLRKEAHPFEFPEEWWAREFEGGGSDPGDVPSFTEFLVDSVFNRELTQTKLKGEARERIRARDPLDLKYHYVGWKAAQSWADLTTDASYAHQPHIRQIVEAVPDFMAHIDTDVPFNYVSLGPGGGDTDANLLEALAGSLEISSLFLVDVSIELLQIAANQIISQVLERHVLKPAPRVRALLADFEDNLSKLAPILMVRDIRNLFTLLGFTIGNGSEMRVLSSLGNGTRPGDYVLCDARLHSHGVLGSDFELSDSDTRDLVAPYDTEALAAFAFGPVEEASDYVVRLSDPSVKVELTPRWGHEFTSSVPSAINVYVEGSGIYENEHFREKMGMRRWSRRNGSDVLRLATLTFYDFGSLTDWIEASGTFELIWKRELEGAGLMLLRRV
jgi:hypothetical protein